MIAAFDRRYMAWIVGILLLFTAALSQNLGAMVILATGVLIAAVLLAAVSVSRLLVVMAVVTLVVAGTAHYYWGILYFYWLAYALGGSIFLRFALFERERWVQPAQISPLLFLATFQILAIATTFAAGASPLQFLLGLKVYLPVWLIAVVLAFRPVTENFVARLEMGALLLAAVQAPFVLEQHLFGPDADAVVGTFGTFCNASLMLACIIAILTAIFLLQSGRMTRRTAVLHVALSFLLLLAGEVKAVIVLLPLGLVVQQTPWIVRHPRRALLAAPLVLAVMGVIVVTYNALYWSGQSTESLREKSIGETFDWTWVNPETGDMGRVTSLAVWVVDRETDPWHRLFGYGAGAARSQSSGAPGLVGARFTPAAVDVTTISQLLWETGVTGVALHMGLIVSGFLAALRLARRATDNEARGRMMTLAALLAVLFVFQFYKNYETSRAAEQLILATLTGLVCAAGRDGRFRGDRL